MKIWSFIFLTLFSFALLGQNDSVQTSPADTLSKSLKSFASSDSLLQKAKSKQTVIKAPDSLSDKKVEGDTNEDKSNLKTPTKEEAKPLKQDKEQKTKDKVKGNAVPPLSEIISWGKIIWSIIIIIIAHFFIKLVIIVLERFAEKSVKHRMTLKSIAPIVRIFSWLIVLIVLIHGIFRPPIETLFAVTASVGIAVGFAAQDILKNIFGGIMIIFDRPFQVGDKIEVGDHYGEVKAIGLRSTRIVTKDDSLVSLPNAEVVNKAVSNSNAGEANCQVVAEIYLPVDIDTNKARQLAIEAAQVSQYIYLNKPIAVLFVNEVKEKRSYLKMRLKAYVSDIRYEFAFQSDMTEIVMKEFIKQGMINKEEIS
ncbi:MAG: mechanosensitive ion channel [Vicingaceae bacterium]